MKITVEMERYIKLQRTGYANSDIQRCYQKDIQKDFDSIKPHLPKELLRSLDIGCGMAGIDLMLYNHYQGKLELHLFDYTALSDSIYYGFRKEAAVYNSLTLSADFLKLNGVEKKRIGIHDASLSFPRKPYDLIISLLSCGFHYPVETYLKDIKDCLYGVLILDIRKNTGQIEVLKRNFKTVETIAEYSKCERVFVK